jgi:ketosteroid isomerase-like protein
MRLLTVGALACLLAGCSTPPPAALQTEDATAQFRTLEDNVTAAWAALDVDKAGSFYAKDAGLLFFDMAPLKYSGWQEYAEGSKKVMSEWKSLKLTLGPDFKAWKQGNVAWAAYTLTFEIEPKTGEVMKSEGRCTDVFEKRADQWLIVHEHCSAPMPEAPPKAAPAKKK